MANNWQLDLVGSLEGTKSRNQLNSDIKGLARNLDKLKLYTEIDKNQVAQLQNQLKKLQIDLNTVTVTDAAINGLVQKINAGLQNITIGNINIGNVNTQAQQVGQQIGNNIAQGVSSGVSKATVTVKSFEKLTESMQSQKIIFNDEGLQNTKLTLDKIKETYAEFGQVKITNKIFNGDELQSFKVNIEQVNGELKETRSFMMSLSDNKLSFILPDDVIKGTEKYVQHLNAAKNATNATGEALNAQNQRLAEQAKYYGNIKEETNHLYSLKQKLLSADELQTAELNKQIKSTKQRITYNNQQLDKKGLRDNSLEREINDLVVAREKQLALSDAKAQDTANTKAQAQAQREANAVLKEQQALQERVNKIQLLSNGGIKNDYATQIAKLEGDFRSLGLAQDTITTKTQNVKNSLATLRAEFAKPVDQQNFQAIQTANDNLQRELIESRNEFEQLRASMKGMATEQQRLTLANTIKAWNQKNSAATREVREENERYIATLRDLNNQMTRMDFNKINTGFKQNENSMRALSRLGASFANQMRQAASSFTVWLSASSAVMRLISSTRQAMTELKEINTILTEISKTSELTISQLEKLGDNAFETASKYGKTASDYLTGVQEMSRAGFVGDHAESMAELSVLAQSAGAITSELANEYLIATNAAYKLNGAVDELNTVLDGQNYITNRNAVSMENLSEATKVTASQAASSGVAIDEMTAAIGTMIATTQQGGDVAGRAFKAILMNIQQVSGELDDGEVIDEESLTKYEKACNDLGVSLKTVKDGVVSLRDPMEILKELSVAYTSLDQMDARRANLINAIGGKYRGNQLNALLENWSTYEKMLAEYSEGAGSAMEEAMKSANNWEGSLNKLKNSWADTIGNIAKSDAVITIINGLDGIVTGINKLTSALGSIGTIGLGAGLFASFKGAGRVKIAYPHLYTYACRNKTLYA